MRSIAIFPCSYTHGASVIGELANRLRLRMYTDELLLADASRQFGITAGEIKLGVFSRIPQAAGYQLKKDKYVKLLRRTLQNLSARCPARRLYYGLHTCLLDPEQERVFKVLVFDEKESRIQRAIRQEGLTRKAAEAHIRNHDARVSGWTRYLFDKEAYDPSLYDALIPVHNKSSLEITEEIAGIYISIQHRRIPFIEDEAIQAGSGHYHYQESQVGCTV